MNTFSHYYMWGITKGVCIVLFVVLFPASIARAVTLFPENANIIVNPGETQEVQLIVANDSSIEKTYAISIVEGQLDPLLGHIVFTTNQQMLTWIEPETGLVSIDSMSQAIVTVSISPNTDVASGNFIAGVQVLEQSSSQGNVSISPGFISLLFITVGNNSVEDVRLERFYTSNRFFAHLPVQFFATMENDGETMSQPGGAVTIRNLFGNIVTAVPFNIGANRLLPGQSRILRAQWGDSIDAKGFFGHAMQEYKEFCIGIFKVEAVIVPFENIAITPEPIWIIVFPWRLVLCMSFALALFLFVAFVFQRKRL